MLTFPKDIKTKTVIIEEADVNSLAVIYRFQTGNKRKYRFEVIDEGGFELANCERTIDMGTPTR